MKMAKASEKDIDAAQPVAWYRPSEEGYDSAFRDAETVARCDGHDWAGWVPLYTAPQPAKREQEPVEIEMPEYHSHGMGCGLEDRGITDRYEAMEYGWYEAIGRVKEELANFGPLYTAPQPAIALDGELLMALAVIRELTGTQQTDNIEATIEAVREAVAPQPAKPAEQEAVAPRGLVWDCVSHPKGGWEVHAHFDVPLDDGATLVAVSGITKVEGGAA